MVLLLHPPAIHTLVYLLCSLCLVAPLPAEETKEKEDKFVLVCTIALVINIILVTLDLVLQELKHGTKHTARQDTAPVIEALFGEVTVLCYLTLFTLCVTEMGFFTVSSIPIFGEEEGGWGAG